MGGQIRQRIIVRQDMNILVNPVTRYANGTQGSGLGVAAISSSPRLRPLQHHERGEDNGHRKKYDEMNQQLDRIGFRPN